MGRVPAAAAVLVPELERPKGRAQVPGQIVLPSTRKESGLPSYNFNSGDVVRFRGKLYGAEKENEHNGKISLRPLRDRGGQLEGFGRRRWFRREVVENAAILQPGLTYSVPGSN